ncbi:MAG: discoidin domain-containing protein, partial [Lachnospiraceae bacterium]|nr:discoidin domain-containing protein [Lachnospiraceae bacterium]
PQTQPETQTQPQTQPSDVNLAAGKSAMASGSENDAMAAALAFDSNVGTRWSSNFADNAWITVDLGQTYSVNKVVLNWEGAYGRDYKIQTSTDGANFTTVKNLVNQDGGEDVITFDAVDARYVRMQGVTRALPYGYSLWEMKVYGGSSTGVQPPTETQTQTETQTETQTQPSGGNLAAGKSATATGSENNAMDAAKAFDSNTGTRWSSNFADNASITVDLGKTYSVNKVVIKWEGAYGKDYKIQTSTDGTNFTTVKNVTGENGGEDVITFNATDARYVRMQGVTRALPYGYSIWEMEVYGGTTSGSERPYKEINAKTATASGTEAAGMAATNAIDKNIATRWSSNFADNAWITVDLGETYSVDKVVLNWEGAYGKDYKIQTSTDGTNFTTVKNVTGENGGEDVITFNATNARYVRMQGVTRGLPYGYSLWEMTVFGR